MIQVHPRESDKGRCSDAPDESIPATGRRQNYQRPSSRSQRAYKPEAILTVLRNCESPHGSWRAPHAGLGPVAWREPLDGEPRGQSRTILREGEDEICEMSSNHGRSVRLGGGAAIGGEGDAEADGAEHSGADVKQRRAGRHQYGEREGTQSRPGDRRPYAA